MGAPTRASSLHEVHQTLTDVWFMSSCGGAVSPKLVLGRSFVATCASQGETGLF